MYDENCRKKKEYQSSDGGPIDFGHLDESSDSRKAQKDNLSIGFIPFKWTIITEGPEAVSIYYRTFLCRVSIFGADGAMSLITLDGRVTCVTLLNIKP